jgi:hypothetical protein
MGHGASTVAHAAGGAAVNHTKSQKFLQGVEDYEDIIEWLDWEFRKCDTNQVMMAFGARSLSLLFSLSFIVSLSVGWRIMRTSSSGSGGSSASATPTR